MNDEQRKAFEEWADDKYVLHKDHDGDYMYTGAKCAFEAWQVAQQIKPLEFQDNGYGVLVAESPMGQVRIIGGRRCWRYSGKSFDTEAEAIEAANADYQRRVLSCLVWGGGE